MAILMALASCLATSLHAKPLLGLVRRGQPIQGASLWRSAHTGSEGSNLIYRRCDALSARGVHQPMAVREHLL